MGYTKLGEVLIEDSDDVGVEFVISAGSTLPPLLVRFVPDVAVPPEFRSAGYAALYQFVEGAVVVHPPQEIYYFETAMTQLTVLFPVPSGSGTFYPYGVIVSTWSVGVKGKFEAFKFTL